MTSDYLKTLTEMTPPSVKQEIDIESLLAGERSTLARAITLFESTRDEDRMLSEKLLCRAMPHTGNAIRIGISGAPGVGKSTFIEAFGNRVTECGKQIAVLTIDPTSSFSGGSILGDKTRMAKLAANPRAFIRPSPSGQTLGGVARRTQEAILACESAGFDLIVVETVGVGQSETLVASMTDIFLLMLSPSSGDELQGIKRGIMELADIVIVNKFDGSMRKQATATAAAITQAVGLIRPRVATWQVPVLLVSASENIGMDEVQQKIDEYHRLLKASEALQKRRQQQAKEWLWNEMREQLLVKLNNDNSVAQAVEKMAQQIISGKLPASAGARKLISQFIGFVA